MRKAKLQVLDEGEWKAVGIVDSRAYSHSDWQEFVQAIEHVGLDCMPRIVRVTVDYVTWIDRDGHRRLESSDERKFGSRNEGVTIDAESERFYIPRSLMQKESEVEK